MYRKVRLTGELDFNWVIEEIGGKEWTRGNVLIEN